MIKRAMIKPVDDGLEADPCSSGVWARVGRQIRRRRTQLGFEIRDVAGNVGIPLATYEAYEAGTQAPAYLLVEIADLFGVPMVSFFQDVADEAGERADTPPSAHPAVYRVATEEHRLQALADTFRKLDLEAQQHLLAISRALSESGPSEMGP